MIDSGYGGAKLFVLDTNVILHDASCLRSFEENDIALPITVLEELDQFKRGKGDINLQAREFLRELDGLSGDVLSEAGVPLGEGLGSVRVVLASRFHERISGSGLSDNPDHQILGTALYLQQSEPHRPVILVSKDTNLRMKAKAFGLPAQDYISDQIESCEKLYSGMRTINQFSSEQISAFYAGAGVGGRVALELLPEVESPQSNENFVLRNGSKSVLATYLAKSNEFVRVDKSPAYGIAPRNAEQSFALRALMDDDIPLVTLVGKAGTGKTILTLAAALERRSKYRQILLARPVIPLSNRDLGYLPGDIAAKLDPYMQPLYDNLSVIRHQWDDASPQAQRIQKMLEEEKLVIAPLPYIRGRSLQRTFFIVDEAQNLTPHEVKTVITRAGEGTKIVFTGDIHQIDHPYLDARSNGLSYVISRMMGQSLYAHVTLEKGERSELAAVASDLL